MIPRPALPSLFVLCLTTLGGIVGGTTCSSAGTVIAIGGGSEIARVRETWSDQVYGRLVNEANGGVIAVVSANDESDWIPTYLKVMGAADAFNIKIATRDDANNPDLIDQIASADGVFLKGGDQAVYIAEWDDTLLETAIRGLFDRGAPIAGTSAGAMVLSDVVYTGGAGSTPASDALRDSVEEFMVYANSFVNLVPGCLIDTHFTARGRIGRLGPFLAERMTLGGESDLLGIGIDERTAVLIQGDHAEVLGEGAVTFLRATSESQMRVEPGVSPVFTNVAFDSLLNGYEFDLATRQVTYVPDDAVPVSPKRMKPKYVSTVIAGTAPTADTVGAVAVTGMTPIPQALSLGYLDVASGQSKLGGGVVVGRAFENSYYDENRVGGCQLALAANPKFVGLLMDFGTQVRLQANGLLSPQPAGATECSLVVIDTRDLEFVGFATTVTNPAFSDGPRQSVALIGAALHVIDSRCSFNASTGAVSVAP